MLVSVALGVALTVLLVGFALITPVALRSVVSAVFSPFLLLGLAIALLVIASVRRVVLGAARKQRVRASLVLVTYVLAALPLGVAAVSLGLVVTLALVFHWQSRFDLVQSLLLLLVGFAMFSVTAKTVLNVQLLVRHWFGR